MKNLISEIEEIFGGTVINAKSENDFGFYCFQIKGRKMQIAVNPFSNVAELSVEQPSGKMASVSISPTETILKRIKCYC